MIRQAALPLFPARGRPRARAPRKAPAPKELLLHMAVADTLRRFALSSWRWSHFPAGEARDPRTGAKLKAMGVQRGWPDFLLLAPASQDRPGGLLHALECKRRGEVLSEAQEAFQGWCEGQGVPHAVVDDARDAMAVLSGWGALRVGTNSHSRGIANLPGLPQKTLDALGRPID